MIVKSKKSNSHPPYYLTGSWPSRLWRPRVIITTPSKLTLHEHRQMIRECKGKRVIILRTQHQVVANAKISELGRETFIVNAKDIDHEHDGQYIDP